MVVKRRVGLMLATAAVFAAGSASAPRLRRAEVAQGSKVARVGQAGTGRSDQGCPEGRQRDQGPDAAGRQGRTDRFHGRHRACQAVW